MSNRNRRTTSQSGFTLVEIAIVLVIIGLLIGGILKGQSMIESAKVKALAKDFQGVQSALYGYQDKFKAIPGDDADVVAHVSGTLSTSTIGPGSGTIDDDAPDTWVGAATVAGNTTVESALFWQHVRLAGLTTGDAAVGQATNSVGGKLGIVSKSNLLHPTTPATATGTFVACASGVPGKVAKQLDILMDDGVGTTGNMFATDEANAVPANGPVITAVAAAAYTDSAIFTVCEAF